VHYGSAKMAAGVPALYKAGRKPAFLKKILPRKIAGLEWLGGFECVKNV
jgi:hypothetical protein